MAGTVIDAHILAVVQIFGYLVSGLGAVFGVSAFIGTRRIRHLTQSLTFGLAGALIIGPVYLYFFAHGNEVSHPLTTAPLYLGFIQGFASGVLGGWAPIQIRQLARYRALRARRVAMVQSLVSKLGERESRLRNGLGKIAAQVEEMRAGTAKLRDAMTSEIAAIEQAEPTSQQEREQFATRKAWVEEAQRLINDAEHSSSVSVQHMEELQAAIDEIERGRRGAHTWEHNVIFRGLPFTVSGYLHSLGQIILMGFMLLAVAGLLATHNIIQALVGGLAGALLSVVLFLSMTQLQSNATKFVGAGLAKNYRSNWRPPLLVGWGFLLGAAFAALPAVLLIPPGSGHLTNQLIVLAADTLAGGVAGAVALRVRYWADRLSDRHYALTGLVLVLIGLAVAIFTQPVLTLLNIRVQ